MALFSFNTYVSTYSTYLKMISFIILIHGSIVLCLKYFFLYLSKVLPRDKPRYLMGVGFALDLVVCSALGVDMYDCVFPSRTARFGSALIMKHPGSLNMKQKVYRTDFSPIEEDCPCATCTRCLID